LIRDEVVTDTPHPDCHVARCTRSSQRQNGRTDCFGLRPRKDHRGVGESERDRSKTQCYFSSLPRLPRRPDCIGTPRKDRAITGDPAGRRYSANDRMKADCRVARCTRSSQRHMKMSLWGKCGPGLTFMPMGHRLRLAGMAFMRSETQGHSERVVCPEEKVAYAICN